MLPSTLKCMLIVTASLNTSFTIVTLLPSLLKLRASTHSAVANRLLYVVVIITAAVFITVAVQIGAKS